MTETRETEIREGFEKWAYSYCLLKFSKTARDMAESAYAAGREDGILEAAQESERLEGADNVQVAWAIRSLSSKKDSEVNNGDKR